MHGHRSARRLFRNAPLFRGTYLNRVWAACKWQVERSLHWKQTGRCRGKSRCADNGTNPFCVAVCAPSIDHSTTSLTVDSDLLRSFVHLANFPGRADFIRAHQERRFCVIWMDFFKSLKRLSTKANKARQTALCNASWQQIKHCWTDYRWLSNTDLFYQTKSERDVFSDALV